MPGEAAPADGRLRIEHRDGCAWVMLDRPPLNLLVPELISAIRDGFADLARDTRVRAAVVTGAGRATTAGMQVQVLRDLDQAGAKTLITLLHAAINLHVFDAKRTTAERCDGCGRCRSLSIALDHSEPGD